MSTSILATKKYILDLVVTSFDTSLAPAVSFTHWSPSDHIPDFTGLSLDQAPLPYPTLHSFRRLSSIDLGSILTDALILMTRSAQNCLWHCWLRHLATLLYYRHLCLVLCRRVWSRSEVSATCLRRAPPKDDCCSPSKLSSVEMKRKCADTVGTVLVPWADHFGFSNAKILRCFSSKLHRSNSIKEHWKTIMVWN